MDVALKVEVFVVASIILATLSRRLLLNPRVHGFYRFFAFEAILALLLLNIDRWFAELWSIRQVVSFLFLVASLYLVVHGFYLLKTVGKPSGNIEHTSVIVDVGLYKYIRHPLYASLAALAVGAALKSPRVESALLLVLSLVLLYLTGRTEEKENIERLGESYRLYMKRTKMFVPFVF